jgi:hypothetical protein
MPGTPTMPVPSMLIKLTLSIVAMPLMVTWPLYTSLSAAVSFTSVPAEEDAMPAKGRWPNCGCGALVQMCAQALDGRQ